MSVPRSLIVLLSLALGCAVHPARPAEPPRSPPPAPVAPPAPLVAAARDALDGGEQSADAGLAEADDEAEMEGAAGEEEAVDPEREARSTDGGLENRRPRYTEDLSDPVLADKWKNDLASLGSVSLGFADEGRLINGRQFPEGDGYTVISPEKTWGTSESVDYVLAAIRRVRELHPEAPPLRVNQISAREGGYLRPHHSHQNGRDVDLAFYYPTAEPVRAREREKYINLALNWELIKALVTQTDVEFILVDRRVQKVLYEYALKAGEDPRWLDSLFHAGRASLLQHARGHRDHFHVRFFNARAQELGRRLAPLLAQRPDENRLMHRVHAGDTLGALARHYGSTVASIQKVNHLNSSFLRLSQVLQIPLRGPCTQCPIPPATVLPPRRLPPTTPVQVAVPLTAPPKAEPAAARSAAQDPP